MIWLLGGAGEEPGMPTAHSLACRTTHPCHQGSPESRVRCSEFSVSASSNKAMQDKPLFSSWTQLEAEITNVNLFTCLGSSEGHMWAASVLLSQGISLPGELNCTSVLVQAHASRVVMEAGQIHHGLRQADMGAGPKCWSLVLW